MTNLALSTDIKTLYDNDCLSESCFNYLEALGYTDLSELPRMDPSVRDDASHYTRQERLEITKDVLTKLDEEETLSEEDAVSLVQLLFQTGLLTEEDTPDASGRYLLYDLAFNKGEIGQALYRNLKRKDFHFLDNLPKTLEGMSEAGIDEVTSRGLLKVMQSHGLIEEVPELEEEKEEPEKYEEAAEQEEEDEAQEVDPEWVLLEDLYDAHEDFNGYALNPLLESGFKYLQEVPDSKEELRKLPPDSDRKLGSKSIDTILKYKREYEDGKTPEPDTAGVSEEEIEISLPENEARKSESKKILKGIEAAKTKSSSLWKLRAEIGAALDGSNPGASLISKLPSDVNELVRWHLALESEIEILQNQRRSLMDKIEATARCQAFVEESLREVIEGEEDLEILKTEDAEVSLLEKAPKERAVALVNHGECPSKYIKREVAAILDEQAALRYYSVHGELPPGIEFVDDPTELKVW